MSGNCISMRKRRAASAPQPLLRQNAIAMNATKIALWGSTALLVYTHVGYAGVLTALARARRNKVSEPAAGDEGSLPSVSVIVAAYAEEQVIADRVANLLRLDYPADKLEVIVSCDGSPDATAERARAAGADLVLELPRRGKVRAQDAAVHQASGEIVAFSDANVQWEPRALRALVAPFDDARVGYVCGDVRFVNDGGSNQEGLYWRYVMA